MTQLDRPTSDAAIAMGVARANEHASRRVVDTGQGIPPDDLPHILDRFWRAEKSRNRAVGWSRPGPDIVKYLVEAQDGRVHVESQVGAATRFVVPWPAGAARTGNSLLHRRVSTHWTRVF